MEYVSTFYDNFIRLCAKRRITPAKVCTAIGAHRSTYTRWAKGAEPKDYTLVKIADYFQVPVESLTEIPDSGVADSALVKAYHKATAKEKHLIDEILKEYMR